jgi:uncharacterized membrane protein
MAARLAETTRLEAFSDGVFAIAITLLVLEIPVPTHAETAAAGGLARALADRWPSFTGFVISFLTIGIMWVSHHAIFQYVRRTDRRFLLVNVLFLMGICLVPFPTAVLAEHLPDAANRLTATVLYGSMFVVMSLLFNTVWWVGTAEGRLLGADVDRKGLEVISKRYRFTPLVYVAALAFAPLSVWITLGMIFLMAIFFMRSERGQG